MSARKIKKFQCALCHGVFEFGNEEEAIAVVEIKRPDGVSIAEMKTYICVAINQWSKGGDPDNPVWNARCLKVNRLTVAANSLKTKGSRRPN